MSNPPLPDSTLFTAANPPPRPITRPPLVHFTTRDVQPPSIVYVSNDDSLLVQLYNSVPGAVISVTYRLLLADGTLIAGVENITPTSDRVRNSVIFNLPEGFLLGCRIAVRSGTVKRGQCWIAAAIGTGQLKTFNATQQFLADYVSSDMPISFPGGRQISSVEGPGFPVVIPQQIFGVNVHPSIVVPDGARWRVQSMKWLQQTDASPGNRTPKFLLFSPAVHTLWSVQALGPLPPGTIGEISAAPAGVLAAGPNNTNVLPLPDNLILTAESQLRMDWSGGGAGDQITLEGAVMEEWIEP
jgi:hypothetical protein